MRIGTLFSGIGAPEQAAKNTFGSNFSLVFACEWDKFARESFKANYQIPEEHFHKDIHNLDGTSYRGSVDCIIGGSPCQDFSVAGLRAGVDGHRGQLIWQYFRVIQEALPPYFIFENVKGMVSDKEGKTLADFLEVFSTIGYTCKSFIINANEYGLPQNRPRLYIIGFLDSKEAESFQLAPKVPIIPLAALLEDIPEDATVSAFIQPAIAANFRRDYEKILKSDKKVFYSKCTSGFQDNKVCITEAACLRAHNSTLHILDAPKGLIRKITPREAFRLQGFPDDFRFVVSNTQLFKQAGNSMAVPVLQMLFSQLQKLKE